MSKILSTCTTAISSAVTSPFTSVAKTSSGGGQRFIELVPAEGAERRAKPELNVREGGQLGGFPLLSRGESFLVGVKEGLPRGGLVLLLFQARLLHAQAALLLGHLFLPGGEHGLAGFKLLPLQATLLGQLG